MKLCECACVCELLARSAVCVCVSHCSFLDLSETLNGIYSVRVEHKPGKSEIFTVYRLQDSKVLICIAFAAWDIYFVTDIAKIKNLGILGRCEKIIKIPKRYWDKNLSINSDDVGKVNTLGWLSLEQDDANLYLAHTGTPALLHPGQREPGEGHPSKDPLPAGLRRQRLPLWRTWVLESEPAGHQRPLLLLVRPPSL